VPTDRERAVAGAVSANVATDEVELNLHPRTTEQSPSPLLSLSREAGPAGRKHPIPLTAGAYDEDVTAHVQSEVPMRGHRPCRQEEIEMYSRGGGVGILGVIVIVVIVLLVLGVIRL
jgi:hypothetical protein